MGDAGVGPGGDARGGVVGRDGVVDVDDEAGLVARVLPGDLGRGAGGAGAGAGDGQLRAAHVELGAPDLLGRVQGDVLGPHQVLAGGELAGQVQGEVCEAGSAWWVLEHVVLVLYSVGSQEVVDLLTVAH